jgi:hypothetical protein
MSANDKQVGGSHYNKDGEQHWDRIYRLFGPGYFVGCATKYIERYHLKNGKEDLEKAIHFIQKLLELEYPEKKIIKVEDISKTFMTYEEAQGYKASEMKGWRSTADGEATSGYVNQD